ncbi:MAG: diguanylate cyclase [Myxococcales bacterium]|nr:diguanylate cyclase [Myxococcales bacterium]
MRSTTRCRSLRATELAMPIRELIEGADFQQTICIGIAIYPQHGKHIEKLLEHADKALYEAKANGRDRAKIYSESMASEKDPGIAASTHVLVVEPNTSRANAYRAALAITFEVVVVGGSEEALALCSRQPFDALVSDEDACGKCGVDFLQKNTAILPMAKRILVLAETDASTAMRGTNRPHPHAREREAGARADYRALYWANTSGYFRSTTGHGLPDQGEHRWSRSGCLLFCVGRQEGQR